MFEQMRNWIGGERPLGDVEAVLTEVQAGQCSVEEAATKIRREARRPFFPRWSLWLLRPCGALLLWVGIGLTVVSVTSGAGKTRVDGTVVELVGEETATPVVEYQAEGVSCRVQGGVALSPS